MSKTINSIGDLINILKIDFEGFNEDVWFRGQSNFDWKLSPGLIRLKNAPSEGTLLTRFKQSASMLLRAQGAMVVNYLLFKWARLSNIKINRSWLLEFDQRVKDNRLFAESNYENADYELLEFDRLSQQGTNDASSIKERLRILKEYIKGVA